MIYRVKKEEFIMNKILVLFVALLISSCSLSQDYKRVSVKELLPVGSTLRLTQTIEMPADRSFIYIAHGKVAPLNNYKTVDIYSPYCTLHVYKESSHARQIMPDQFEITKIDEWETSFGRLDFKNNTYANNHSGNFVKVTNNGNDGGPSILFYATILSLRSAKQPDVKELVCGHWNDPSEIEPLTLEEMKSALGDLLPIVIADNIKII